METQTLTTPNSHNSTNGILSGNKRKSNLYMLLVVIAAFVSLVCVAVITGIWFWLYSSNNLGREEQKGTHFTMFVFGIIDLIFMVLWIAAMIASIVMFKKIKMKNKFRITIHYASVLVLYIVFGCVVVTLLSYYLTWKFMDPIGRQVALVFVGLLEVLRILLLLSILVTSVIYLIKNNKRSTKKSNVNLNNIDPSNPSINEQPANPTTPIETTLN